MLLPADPDLAASLPAYIVRDAVRRALEEDLGRAGDITSAATIPADATAEAGIVARRPGVIAGMELAVEAFASVDPAIGFSVLMADGDTASAGSVLARIHGPARGILTAERTALNFLGHLSGIASATAAFVEAVKGTGARITCTRKTTPGLRALEKYAVRCGGGSNHRFGLDDAVLIKDNHIAIAGGIAAAIEQARRSVGHLVKIEVEVDTLEQLAEALSASPDAVLLDNMSEDQLREAVRLVGDRATTEASGGVTIGNVRAIAETGVDAISSGWITHSAPSLDVALDVLS
jgi:nicotinate-nucleotide pyrophosphorylase (carboxylating)